MFDWHFTLRGPRDTEFEGGIYHGRILLPSDYPFKPPNIILLTVGGEGVDSASLILEVAISSMCECCHVAQWPLRGPEEDLPEHFGVPPGGMAAGVGRYASLQCVCSSFLADQCAELLWSCWQCASSSRRSSASCRRKAKERSARSTSLPTSAGGSPSWYSGYVQRGRRCVRKLIVCLDYVAAVGGLHVRCVRTRRRFAPRTGRSRGRDGRLRQCQVQVRRPDCSAPHAQPRRCCWCRVQERQLSSSSRWQTERCTAKRCT